MLDALRQKQKGIMIVVAIVVIIAFAFLYSEYDFDQVASLEAFAIDGRKYRVSEVDKLQRVIGLASGLGMQEFVGALRGWQNQDPDGADYAISLLVLRKQARELGIRPSNDEIAKFIKQLPFFQGDSGGYDAKRFEQFKESALGPRGLSMEDLYEIVGDGIAFEKIQGLANAGLVPSASVIDEYFARENTQVTALRVDFPREKFTEGPEVTDEEISKYYEANKATIVSDPKRRIEFVFFARPEKLDELPEEERKAKLKAYGETVSAFAREVLVEGAVFSEVAKKSGVELRNTPAFAYGEPPEEIKDVPELLGEVFRATLQVPISDPIHAEKGYYLFNLLEVKDAEPLSLADATPRLKEQLADQAVNSRMNTAANEARGKLLDALKSGKQFADAAKELGLEPKEIPVFSRSNPPSDQPDASSIASAAALLKEGDISIARQGVSGAFIVYVKEKKLLSDETAATARKEIADNIRRFDRLLLFSAWFEKAKNASGVVKPVALEESEEAEAPPAPSSP